MIGLSRVVLKIGFMQSGKHISNSYDNIMKPSQVLHAHGHSKSAK